MFYRLPSSPRISDEGSPPFVPQKRIKLLDTSKSYIGDASPEKLKINVSDISDLIDDDDKLQVSKCLLKVRALCFKY